MSVKVYNNDFQGNMFKGINRYTYGSPLESQGFGRQELELIKQWFPLFNTDYHNIATKTSPGLTVRATRLSEALDPNDIVE